MITLPDAPQDLHAEDACVTTHVLDLIKGAPGAGMKVTLSRILRSREESVAEAVTDARGRLPAPLLTCDAARSGLYVITFETADSFFGRVAVEFAIDDPGRHHHVPLVLSPFGFSTYRGAPPHRAPEPVRWAARPVIDVPAEAGPPPGTLGPGMTVHVIDLAHGIGAGGMAVGVTTPAGAVRTGFVTNSEGRTADWLIGPGALEVGTYEIRFDLGAYFATAGKTSFFPHARVWFRVTNPAEHHHIPLLVAPTGYSCYRGS